MKKSMFIIEGEPIGHTRVKESLESDIRALGLMIGCKQRLQKAILSSYLNAVKEGRIKKE